MAQVAHVPHVPRAATTAIVAAVIGAGAAVGIVAITHGLGSDNTTASSSLPSGAAFVQPAAPAPALSAPATAAIYHTPR
jgi:hypothetical protein